MNRPYILLACVVLLSGAPGAVGIGPAAAQSSAPLSPPQGVLRAPAPGAKPARPTPPPAPPKAAPIAGVTQVKPFSSPVVHPPPAGRSTLGHSAPGRATATAPPRRATAHKPPRRTPVVRAPRAPVRKARPAAGHATAKPPAPGHASAKPPAAPARPAAPLVAGAAAGIVVANAGKPGAAPAAPPEAKPPAPERPEIDPRKGAVTGMMLPRWVALRSADVNMRTGPGMRYPIEWQYHRRNLPVMLEREFEVWRLVEDQDGVKGWVHQANLTSQRGFVLRGRDETLRAQPAETAAAVALVKSGVLGRILSCKATAAWCQVRAGAYTGWLKRAVLWGISPDEAVGG